MNNGNAPPLATRRVLEYARVAVDVANTAFWEGKEYRISREFEVNGTPLVFRFTAVGDFILQLQSVSVDAGNLSFKAYRATQGTESGAFTDVPIYGQNIMSVTPARAPTSAVAIGGAFTPSIDELPVEVIRLRTSGSTAQRSSVSGAVGDERGLSAGVYYLELARIDGNEIATGVFDLKWEER